MKRTDMHGAAQFSEGHALLRVGVERLARPLHNSQLARQAARLTPLARPITGSFGLLGGIEEFDVVTPRLPRRQNEMDAAERQCIEPPLVPPLEDDGFGCPIQRGGGLLPRE